MKRKKLLLASILIFLLSGLYSQEEEIVQEDLLPSEETVTELSVAVPAEPVAEEFSAEEPAPAPAEPVAEEAIPEEITYEEADFTKNSPSLTFFYESFPDFYPAEIKKNPVRKEISLAPEEILQRPEVEKFRKQYLSPKWAAALRSYLENAMEYRLYVRKAVQDNQVPEILEYLPVVESNYKTNAKSRSGAIGMWQFMANSVWPFLTLNDYVDERLDPWKSTDAAIKKLQDNYRYFNDWPLAIAAYNCGMGALTRIIKKAKAAEPEESNIDFWYLVDKKLLPDQTANYVPKLIAIADLAINSEYYGIDLPSHEEEFEILENEKNGNFDYISVKKAYSLSQIAQEMRMDTASLKRLNPSYVLGMTHPSRESEIRLPLGMKQSALDALEKVEPIEFPIKYTVTAGDSLWSISRRYKVTVEALCELNNIQENAILKIGKILYIPAK